MVRFNQAIRLFAMMLPSVFTFGSSAIAEAQDDGAAQAILVLDASGSMWGQVDGLPKISIAQDVIGDLLNDWNPATELGVMAYGHRTKKKLR